MDAFYEAILGFGLGAQLVAAFSEAQKAAVKAGFPDNLATYALISSLWTSTFALGAFVGPTAAGALRFGIRRIICMISYDVSLRFSV